MPFDWKAEYEDWESIPEGAKDAYEEKGGKVTLVRALQKGQLENSYKREQERRKEAEAKLKGFEGIKDVDLEKIHDDLEELQELRDLREAGSLDGKNKEEIDALVEKRVETERKKFERENAKLQTELQQKTEALGQTSGRLSKLTLEGKLTREAEKLGVKPHGMRILKRFGLDEFQLDDAGEIVDRTDAGRTIADWLQNEIEENPTLTVDLKSASMGADNGGGGGGKRTYKRAEFDQLAKENPAEASKIMSSVKSGEASLVD